MIGNWSYAPPGCSYMENDTIFFNLRRPMVREDGLGLEMWAKDYGVRSQFYTICWCWQCNET